MHHLGNNRLTHQLQRFAAGRPPGQTRSETEPRAAAHDMLVMSSRPDLTPEFPAALRHPTQSDRTPLPSHPRP